MRADWPLHPGVLIAVFLGVFLYVHAFEPTLIDDTFIQLQYADNLVENGTWGFFPERPANTATSPLNVLLTAAAAWLLPSTVEAGLLLTAIELTLALVLLLRISRSLFGHGDFGWIAAIALVTNPLLLSTIGLESILFSVLFIACLHEYLGRRWILLAVSLGLLTLSRHDGVLLFVILSPLVLRHAGGRARWQYLLTYVGVLSPWHLYSWVVLGSFVPDTLVIKTWLTVWGEAGSFPRGLGDYYLSAYPVATLASFSLALFAGLALLASDRRVRSVAWIVTVYALVHTGAYAWLAVPPYHWYFVHLALASVLTGGLGLTVVVDWLTRRRSENDSDAAAATGLGRVAAVVLPAWGLIALVLQQGFPFEEAPIHTNWGSHAQYREIGNWLRQNVDADRTIGLNGEVGCIAYYSKRRLVNNFTDQNRIGRLDVDRSYLDTPLFRTLSRLNFYWRRPREPLEPPSYVLQHRTANPRLRQGVDYLEAWPVSSRWSEHLVDDEMMMMYLREAR